MATAFSMVRDINGFNGFGLPFSDQKYSATLAQNTDTSLTVPGGMPLGYATQGQVNVYLAIFSYEPGAQVWVALNEAATTPAGASFASVSSELNPSARRVAFGDTLHFYSPDVSAAVGVTFYALF